MSKSRSRYKVFVIAVISFSVIFMAGLYLVTMNNLLNSYRWELHEEMTDEEKERFCSMALIPELKDHCVRYGKKTINYTKTLICVECSSCGKLPEKYQAAFDKALKSDDSFNSTDLNDQTVKYFNINEGMPLADVNDLPAEYRDLANRVIEKHYQVMSYGDGHDYFVFWFEYR